MVKLTKVSNRLVTKKIKVRKTKYKINDIEYMDENFNMFSILEELLECDYGFDSGLCNLNKEAEEFLVKTKLAEKASRGGYFPTDYFFKHEKKIRTFMKELRGW